MPNVLLIRYEGQPGPPMEHISKQPHHVAAMARLNAMQKAIVGLEKRQREIEKELVAETPPGQSPNDDQADRILAGNYVHPTRAVSELRDEHVVIREKLEVLRKAYRKGFEAFGLLQDRLSHAATIEFEARHRAIAGRQAEALLALQATIKEEFKLEREVHFQGYDPKWLANLRWAEVLGFDTADGGPVLAARIGEMQRYANGAPRGALDLGPVPSVDPAGPTSKAAT